MPKKIQTSRPVHVIFKSDKLDYLRGPRKEFFFDNLFSIGQGPSNVGKMNWNLLGFFSFIFCLGQCDLNDYNLKQMVLTQKKYKK
jgi:hypothetical protein